MYRSIPNEKCTSIGENGFPGGPVSKCIYEGQEVGRAGGFLGTDREVGDCLLPKIKKVYLYIFSVSLSAPVRVALKCIDRRVFCSPVSLFVCQLASRLVCLSFGLFQLTSGLVFLSAWLCIVLPAFLLICPVCLVNLWDVLSVSMSLYWSVCQLSLTLDWAGCLHTYIERFLNVSLDWSLLSVFLLIILYVSLSLGLSVCRLVPESGPLIISRLFCLLVKHSLSAAGLTCLRACLLIGLLIVFFSFYVLYSTLLHMPPLRFHCFGGSRLRHWQSDSLITRLDLILIVLSIKVYPKLYKKFTGNMCEGRFLCSMWLDVPVVYSACSRSGL